MNARPLFSVMAGLDPATQWPRVCAAAKRTKRPKLIDDANESPARTDVRALGGRVKPGHDELEKRVPATIGDMPLARPLFYIRSHHRTPATALAGDVTCDGNVMAEMAEFCGCDGVMDRIASVFENRAHPAGGHA